MGVHYSYASDLVVPRLEGEVTARWNAIHQIQDKHDCEILNSDGEKDAGCSGKFEEGHHGIFERSHRVEEEKEWRMFLEHPINFTRACHSCNFKRVADPEKARDLRFSQQLLRHGTPAMRVWMQSAPAEIKERAEYKRYWKQIE